MHMFFLVIIAFLGIGFFVLEDDFTNIPTFSISCVAMLFAYYAYHHAREKFRLDLMDKRWAFYNDLLKYCGVVARHGGLPSYNNIMRRTIPQKEKDSLLAEVEEAHQVAHLVFRGKGYHYSKMLFGQDVGDVVEKLNSTYATLVAYDEVHTIEANKKNSEAAINILKLNSELPLLFKPYISFSDYKNTDYIPRVHYKAIDWIKEKKMKEK